MKKRIVLIWALILALTACGGKEEAKAEITVFAAASLQDALTEIGENYRAAGHENVDIVFNFDSSGTLKTQIQEGADCDVFISAGQKQMDQLDASASPEVNTEDLDFVREGTRVDWLENEVVLAVPDGNPAGVNSYEDLKAALEAGDVLLAMGNSDVPVGQYTQKILKYFGLDEADLAATGSITYGSNVREVTTQVSEAVADCGIIYSTDAKAAGLTVVDVATKEMCGEIVYPLAMLKDSREAAEDFRQYLLSSEAAQVLANHGFKPLAPLD